MKSSGFAIITSVGATAVPRAANLQVGAGVGPRYDMATGLVRANIAYPLVKQRGKFACDLQIGIGQAF